MVRLMRRGGRRKSARYINVWQCDPSHEYSMVRPAPHIEKGNQDTHLATFGFAGPPVSGAFFTMTFSLPHRDPIVHLDPRAATYRSPLLAHECARADVLRDVEGGRCACRSREAAGLGGRLCAGQGSGPSPENSRMNTWCFRHSLGGRAKSSSGVRSARRRGHE